MGFALVSVPKILVKNACQSFAEKRSAHILLKPARPLLDSVALILSDREKIHTFEFCHIFVSSIISSYAPYFYIVITDKKPVHHSQVQFLL